MDSRRSARRLLTLAAPLLGALLGCAGVGPPRAAADERAVAQGWAARRGYAGRWVGSWRSFDSPVGVVEGTLVIDVSERGAVRGTIWDAEQTVDGTITGLIRPRQRFNGACAVPAIERTFLLDGTLDVREGRTASGTISVRLGSLRVGTLDLALARR